MTKKQGSRARLHVAISGARGIPGRYGGFESAMTELAPRLVDRGLDVSVYCRADYSDAGRPENYRGVRLIYLPALRHRSLESLSAEALCAAHAVRHAPDVLYVLGFRASIAYSVQLLRRTRVVFNTDGFDWQRSKWGRTGRTYLRWSERVGVKLATGGLIADSRAIAKYYADRYSKTPAYLSYGAHTVTSLDEDALSSVGLVPRKYYLVVARVDPENHVRTIIRSYLASDCRLPLIVVGGTNYPTAYAGEVRQLASAKVRLLGAVYDEGLVNALYRGCAAYIHGHEVGGTNPSLLRAMGAGALVLANDVQYNREVLGDCGLYWSPSRGDLARCLNDLEGVTDGHAELGRCAQERAARHYDWESIADGHVEFFRNVVHHTGRLG